MIQSNADFSVFNLKPGLHELDETLDNRAAATLFIGTIQGLLMQSLLFGYITRIRRDAPEVFAIYQRDIRRGS